MNNDNIITDYELYIKTILDDPSMEFSDIPQHYIDNIHTTVGNILYLTIYDYNEHTISKVTTLSPIFLRINEQIDYEYEARYENPLEGNVERTILLIDKNEKIFNMQTPVYITQPFTIINPILFYKDYPNLQINIPKIKELIKILTYAYIIFKNVALSEHITDEENYNYANNIIKTTLIRFNIYVKKFIYILIFINKFIIILFLIIILR